MIASMSPGQYGWPWALGNGRSFVFPSPTLQKTDPNTLPLSLFPVSQHSELL